MLSKGNDWDTLLKKYCNRLRFEKNLSANTVRSYRSDLVLFRKFIEEEYSVPPQMVTGSHIEQFMSTVYDRGIKASSQARLVSSINGFFSFLVLENLMERSPAEMIDKPRISRKLPDVLSVQEIDAIVNAAGADNALGVRNRAMLELLYSCGLRVSELVELRFGDLFFEDGFIRVTGKGSKQRLVPVSGTAAGYVLEYMASARVGRVDTSAEDIVFLNRRGNKLSRVMIFNIIRKAALEAGITKHVSPHTMRHSFATHLLEGGASIRHIQEMLGHESILTTEIYTHVDRKRLGRLLEDKHPLGARRIK